MINYSKKIGVELKTQLEKARLIQSIIHKILINEWDPIGVKNIPEAQDEYDLYIPTIYQLLLLGQSKDEIFNYLWWLETEHMGLIADRQKTEKISEDILRIYSSEL